mmetsp:Transcript_7462/g.27409  ORF Transcript_7462/g.27409 Transcript_7462/m.27409 type:complete len:251 (+) Transcript_7462:586-1338(+)
MCRRHVRRTRPAGRPAGQPCSARPHPCNGASAAYALLGGGSGRRAALEPLVLALPQPLGGGPLVAAEDAAAAVQAAGVLLPRAVARHRPEQHRVPLHRPHRQAPPAPVAHGLAAAGGDGVLEGARQRHGAREGGLAALLHLRQVHEHRGHSLPAAPQVRLRGEVVVVRRVELPLAVVQHLQVLPVRLRHPRHPRHPRLHAPHGGRDAVGQEGALAGAHGGEHGAAVAAVHHLAGLETRRGHRAQDVALVV